MTIHTRLNTIELPALTRAAEVRSQSFDADANTVDVIWTTGATVRRNSCVNGLYNEELVVTPQAVRLDRLNAGAPFLNSHGSYDVTQVIGSVVPGSARISNGTGLATIQLSRRPEVAGIVGDIRDGVLRNVSVGYRYHRIEKIEGSDGKPPTWRVVDWEPLEISAVAVSADPGAQVRSAPSATFPCTVSAPTPPDPATAAAVSAAVTAYRAQHQEHQHMRVQIIQDEREARARGMSDAIVSMLAQTTVAPGRRVDVSSQGRQWMGRSLAELAGECIGYRGRLMTARQVMETIERGMHATSDFPGILTNALNARLLQRYVAAPATYRLFCGRMTARDYRAVNVIRAGDFPSLQPILESGEVKAGQFSESREQFQVYAYGVTFNITRQLLLNDSLQAIEQMLSSVGDRVALWENALAFQVLLSGSGAGPTLLTDGLAVFHTTHGNLAAVPSAIDVANVGLGYAAMAKQKSLDGMNLNLAPSVLLCGPDKAVQAHQLVTGITPAQTSTAVPDYIRRITPVSDAGIAGAAWYLFAPADAAPCFVYGGLEGFEAPRVSIADGWGVQGIKVKCEHDFGVNATDFRGGYRNAGA